MQTLIFTGPFGSNALATALTAAAAAAVDARVLMVSVGPSHPLATLVGKAPLPEPQALAPKLDLWCLEPLAGLNTIWEELRPSGGPALVGDELPIVPGIDIFLAITQLAKLAQGYDLVCLDAGPPEVLLRALGIPDSFRWLVRLLIGLDRGPGRSSASVTQAVIPTALLPIPGEWIGGVQEARAALERLRDAMVAPAATQVRYVLPPDRAGLAEARLNIAAFQLFGLAVERLIAGPLLPVGTPGLSALVDEQTAMISEAGTIWHGRPVYSMAATPMPLAVEQLTTLGTQLYGQASPLPNPPPPPPITMRPPPDAAIMLDLPGVPREALGLTLSGDELIVRIGPYRRHLLLPEGLRGMTAIRAARQGEQLVISQRK
ncbi:MAG: chromosome partitioning protein [Candidatus Viridilinea halotolerans]|uniref:Chromosome partitioning protein n=1 Tax=Candidatus Viridilinea halotolerans TaxID=2491704 RepID=A0A426TWM2_9CHLR|nr:MAG: chromosome partitioning protein [Candidatus Viridilinea halotolerans]